MPLNLRKRPLNTKENASSPSQEKLDALEQIHTKRLKLDTWHQGKHISRSISLPPHLPDYDEALNSFSPNQASLTHSITDGAQGHPYTLSDIQALAKREFMDTNTRNGRHTSTPLMEAAIAGNKEKALELILENSTLDLTTQNQDGKDAVLLAFEHQHYNLCFFLLFLALQQSKNPELQLAYYETKGFIPPMVALQEKKRR